MLKIVSCIVGSCFFALAVHAADPPVDVIRMESEALLQARLEQQIDRQAIAKEIKLPWPVAQVSKTPMQIREELAARGGAPAAPAAARIDEAQLLERAKQKFPLANSGEVVSLSLGLGGAAEGKLELSDGGVIKVGGRAVRHSSLSPEAQLMLDPAGTAKAREAWIAQERDRLNSVAGTAVIGGDRKLEAELYRRSGYIWWRNQWISPENLLNRAVEYRRKEAANKLKPAVIQEVAGRYGFKWEDGKWVSLAPKAVADVASDDGGDKSSESPGPENPDSGVAVEPAAAVVKDLLKTDKKSTIESLFELEIDAPADAAAPVVLPAPMPVEAL